MKNKILNFLLVVSLVLTLCITLNACKDANSTIYAGKELSLTKALEQVSNGGTIILDQNITLDSQVVVNKQVTIDLGGFAINNTQDIWNNSDGIKTWSLISVQAGGNLTIKNGSMLAKENDCYAIDVRDGASLTVESGDYVGNISVVYVHTGNAEIKGGNFKIQQLDDNFGDHRHLLNCLDANWQNQTASITVTGGVFENYDPSNNQSLENNLVAEGYSVTSSTANGNTYYSVISNNAT